MLDLIRPPAMALPGLSRRRGVGAFVGIALVLATSFVAAQESYSRTWANPVDIDYRYNFEQMHEGISYRTGADPAVVRYGDAYYLFLTLADGYWRSTDLLHWQFIKPSRWPFDSEVAPATLVAGGKLFLMQAATQPRPLLYSTDPAHGRLDFWTRLLPPVPGAVSSEEHYTLKPGELPPGPWDPGLFQDEDGKTYLYWGSSNVHPLYAAQIDLKLGAEAEGEGKRLTFITKPQALFTLHPAEHGWERFGQDHTDEHTLPFMEGAWMNRHGDRYYLQYAAPGTEYNAYGTGVYVGKGPLGPFDYAPYNPIGEKPGGFVQGVGHGSTFQDAYGNWWNTGTSWIGSNWTFERRVGLYRAGFHADGQMWVDTRFGDFPQRMPDHRLKENEDTFAGWMLLSYRKTATASSTLAGHPASAATDENPRTSWVAASNTPGQMLMLDLGGERTVRAVQVNFADFQSGRYGDAPDIVAQFRIEGSRDGEHWDTLADLSHETRDRPDAYLELPQVAHVRYVRYVHGHVGAHTLAIADLRVFGNADGASPAAPARVTARRLADTRNAQITWSPVPGAVGYNVRWGLSADRLHSTYQRFADQPTTLTLRSLNKGVHYVVAVEAFDENGVSALSATQPF